MHKTSSNSVRTIRKPSAETSAKEGLLSISTSYTVKRTDEQSTGNQSIKYAKIWQSDTWEESFTGNQKI